MTMYYSQYHEWVLINGTKARVGITDKAQHELKEIVFIDLPSVGKAIGKGQEICVVESTKAATDLCSPLSGKITHVNDHLKENCMQMQTMSEKDRWIYEIELDDLAELDELLTEGQYRSLQCH